MSGLRARGPRRGRLRRLGAIVAAVLATGCMTGCATVASLNDPLDGGPIVMSGTRLDLAALEDRARAAARFDAEPPRWPLLDLPFSAALDLFALGFTLPAAAALLLAGRDETPPPPPPGPDASS